MGFNFPNSPTPGQLYTPAGGYQYVYLDGVWRVVEAPQAVGTAETRNRIVNGAMQVSQENGVTTGSVTGYYPADQWIGVHSGITSFVSAMQIAGSGAPNQIYVQGVKASLAAGDYCFHQQKIEGVRVKDFAWGFASALPAVLRFDAYSGIAGTYSAAIQNAVPDRSFIAPFTLPAGAWTTISIPVPGDTTGTWPVTTGLGMTLSISCAIGSTYIGVNGWQAGNKLGAPGVVNGMATANTFYLRNVGLYLDPLATGIPPAWEMPDEAEELRACQRYWALGNIIINTTATSIATTLPVQMRASPAVTGGGAGFVVQTAGAQFITLGQTSRTAQNLVFNIRM